MDLLGIATEIENKLKEKKLVDKRLGSGFCFIDNSRDVQLEYPKAVRDYFSQLEETIAEITKNNLEVEVTLNYRSDNFSFYVKPAKDSSICDEILEGIPETEEEPMKKK